MIGESFFSKDILASSEQIGKLFKPFRNPETRLNGLMAGSTPAGA